MALVHFALRTKLFYLKALLDGLFILLRMVIDRLAVGALELNQIILRHIFDIRITNLRELRICKAPVKLSNIIL